MKTLPKKYRAVRTSMVVDAHSRKPISLERAIEISKGRRGRWEMVPAWSIPATPEAYDAQVEAMAWAMWERERQVCIEEQKDINRNIRRDSFLYDRQEFPKWEKLLRQAGFIGEHPAQRHRRNAATAFAAIGVHRPKVAKQAGGTRP